MIRVKELGLGFAMDNASRTSATTQLSTHTSSNSSEQRSKHGRRAGVQVSLDNCNDVLCYLEDYGVLVCKDHRTGVLNLDTHLLQYHNVRAAARRKVVERFQHLALTPPKDIDLPDEPAQPIEELGAPLDALQCSTCPFLTVSKDAIRIHCRKEHDQRWAEDTHLLYKAVKAQTFFRTAGMQRYWIVEAAEAGDVENAHVDVTVQRQLAAYKLTQQLVESELQRLEEATNTDKAGWFKRTGWLDFLKDRNLKHLSYQARAPDANERRIKLAAELTEELVERSVRGLATLPQEMRRWLRSAKHSEPDVRPLARLQNPESQARYASYLMSFVCFYLRVLADEEQRILRVARKQTRPSLQLADSSEESEESEESEQDSSIDKDSEEESDAPRPWRTQRTKRSSEGAMDKMRDARDLFTWTERQKRCAISLWDLLDTGDRGAQMEALLESIGSFILTQYHPEPLSTGLMQFLAVLGYDIGIKRLRTAKNYSYILAGMVYCVRVIAAENILPSGQRNTQTAEDRDRFLSARHDYLSDGTFTPMSAMLSLLAYSKHVGMTVGNAGNAYWSTDKQTFYLNGRPIEISRFRKMAQDLVADTSKALWELCWVDNEEERPTIHVKQIVDDVSFTKRGASFVSTPTNKLEGGLAWMLTRAMTTSGGARLKQADGEWSVKAVRRYLRQVDRFLELLLCSVHITSGQPGRGSEILSMRHRNGMLQDRNVYVVDGQVMTVVRYHKSQSQWDKPRVVPRFLPPELGLVMMVYLAYIQPFKEYLTLQVLGGSYSDYVWHDEQGAWGTDRLTRVLKRETQKRLGVKLHTLDYRHTAVGIGRVYVAESFSRGYQDDVGEEEDEAEVDGDGEDLLELQNARTTVIGVGNYSVPIDIVKHLSVRSIEAFRPLSAAWHRFLGIDGMAEVRREAIASSALRKRLIEASMSGMALLPKQKEVRVENPREDKIRTALQQVLGSQHVSFRSVEQEQAMHAVLDRQTPLVVVLPTGGGKSLLFTVPAVIEQRGVTIVVVPYVALINNLVERIQSSGIECRRWKHGEENPASVVVVSADIAGDVTNYGNFLSYAGLLLQKGLLQRIVVDECHLIFSAHSWRPNLALLKNLRLLGCPIVLLTATLPPVWEHALEAGILIHNATYIRASTVRPNTRYFVSWCEPEQKEQMAVTIASRRQEQLQGRGLRGVVYCRSKELCEDLAAALGCAFYHSEVEIEDKAKKLEEWQHKGGLIVATSALGTGVDYPGIVYILHVGMPWSMIDYAQESGRGGRAGEVVDSVILVGHGEVEETLAKNADNIDVSAIGFFIIGSGCRRLLMSRYMDRVGVSCSDLEGSAGCDRCGDGLRPWLDEQQRHGREWEQMEQLFDELRAGCVACCMMHEAGSEEWRDHRTMQCTAHSGVTGRDLDEFRKAMIKAAGPRKKEAVKNNCWRCWVSQKYCATGEDREARCQWPNVVVPLARAAAEVETGVKIIRKCGYRGDLGGDWNEYAGWLSKRHEVRVWDERELFSNVMVVAIRVAVFIAENCVE